MFEVSVNIFGVWNTAKFDTIEEAEKFAKLSRDMYATPEDSEKYVLINY